MLGLALASVFAFQPALPSEAAEAAKPASGGHTATLSGHELLVLAERAEKADRLLIAERVYEALSHDKDQDVRAEALWRHGRMLSRVGRKTEAALKLRRLLDERADAHIARLELAAILTHLGDEQAARRELRAVRTGKLPPYVASLVDRWSQALRASKPVGLSVEVAIAPDTNINRATTSDALGTVLGDFQIDPNSANSGVGLATQVSAYRRVELSPSLRVLARVTTLSNLYREKQFNLVAAEVVAGPEFSVGSTQVSLEAGASGTWYGGSPFLRQGRLTATGRRPFGARTAGTARASISRVTNLPNALQDGRSMSMSLSAERALSRRNGMFVHGSVERFHAIEPAYATFAWKAGLHGWHDLGRLTVLAGIEFGKLAADERLFLLPERRRDTYSKLSLGVTIRSLTFASIAPFVRLSREANRSNIAFYDYRRTRTELGFSRAF
jgi:hypothetical protein